MKKIIISYCKPRKEEGTGTIRVSAKVENILRGMSAKTGLSISKIASILIEQASEVVEFVEVDNDTDQ
jgi:hypothetical protein